MSSRLDYLEAFVDKFRSKRSQELETLVYTLSELIQGQDEVRIQGEYELYFKSH